MFSYYKCTSLAVPSVFSREDLVVRKRNCYCFVDDLLYFKKEWFVELTNEPETAAVEVINATHYQSQQLQLIYFMLVIDYI